MITYRIHTPDLPVKTTFWNTTITKSHTEHWKLGIYDKIFSIKRQTWTFNSSNHTKDQKCNGEVNILQHPKNDVDIGLEEGAGKHDNAGDVVLGVHSEAGIISKYEWGSTEWRIS